jgi:hypothetical protein
VTAIRISKMLRSYGDIYGPKEMNTIMIRITFLTATTLVFSISKLREAQTGRLSELQECLKSCDHVLGLMESVFTAAKSTRTTLSLFMKRSLVGLDTVTAAGESSSRPDYGLEVWNEFPELQTLAAPMDWLSAPSGFDFFDHEMLWENMPSMSNYV